MEKSNPEVSVKINEKAAFSYPIFIGENLLQNAQKYISKYTKAKKILVVTNKTIANLYRNALNLENAENLAFSLYFSHADTFPYLGWPLLPHCGGQSLR